MTPSHAPGTNPASGTNVFSKTKLKSKREIHRSIAIGIYCAILTAALPAQTAQISGMDTTTQDRMEEPGWWPTKGDAPRSNFAGTKTCQTCHESKVLSQALTPMARAGNHANDSKILRDYSPLVYESGPYTYRISKHG